MRKNLTFFLFMLPFVGWAQVTEGMKDMSTGSNNALSTTILGLDVKTVEKLWKDYADKFGGKSKYNRKASELFIDNASIPNISGNTIDLYSKAEKAGDHTNFSVWFDLGGGYLVGADHPDKYTNARSLVEGFVQATEKYKVEERLKEANKQLDKLKSDMKGLAKDKDGYEKDIKKAEDAIKSAQEKIVSNASDQTKKETEIKAQEDAIEAIKSELSKYN